MTSAQTLTGVGLATPDSAPVTIQPDGEARVPPPVQLRPDGPTLGPLQVTARKRVVLQRVRYAAVSAGLLPAAALGALAAPSDSDDDRDPLLTRRQILLGGAALSMAATPAAAGDGPKATLTIAHNPGGLRLRVVDGVADVLDGEYDIMHGERTLGTLQPGRGVAIPAGVTGTLAVRGSGDLLFGIDLPDITIPMPDIPDLSDLLTDLFDTEDDNE